MTAVVSDDWREFEAGEDAGIVPRAGEHSGKNDLVSLIKVRQSTIGAKIHFIEGRVIAVEVGGVINSSAVCVVSYQRHVLAETFPDLQDSALIERRRDRGIDVVLQNCVCGIRKAQSRIGDALRRVPVLKGKAIGGKAIRSCTGYDRCAGKQICVHGPRQSLCVDVDVIGRNGESWSKFLLDSQ